MYKIHCLNKISPAGLANLGDNYSSANDFSQADAVLVRSAAMHDLPLSENLLAIARAGAGVNNIPIEKCSEKGIAVFNTPGANSNAVKELVICMLIMTSRNIVPAVNWAEKLKETETLTVAKQVEKGKSAFVGPEIKGKKLGVIGLGAIGISVANAANDLGMEVYGYDPYLSVDAAWKLSRAIRHAHTLDEIFADCDYITLHVPLKDDTRNLICTESINKMKNGVRILNFARGGLVNTQDILEALKKEKVAAYATDFLEESLLNVKGVIPVPHLGASTPESEDNCATMAVNEIRDYLENGNVKNSVNLPSVSMARESGRTRICLFHKNIPNTIGLLSGVLGSAGINIEDMASKSRKEYAYTILDVTGSITGLAIETINNLEPIIRVRVLL